MQTKRTKRPPAERLADHAVPATDLSPNGMAGCLLYNGKGGKYATIADANGRIRPAHRLAYELAHGPIPSYHQVDHLCWRPGCVNVEHLEAVTRAENCRRGRATRLTVAKVRQLREDATRMRTAELAAKYGVSVSYCRLIVRGLYWRDI